MNPDAIKTGGQAFPFEPSGYEPQWGMTLRDKFADSAMQGLLAAGRDAQYGADSMEQLALHSYRIADAMLAARNQS